MARLLHCTFLIVLISCLALAKEKEKEKPEWAKKNIMDFNDVDIERLYDQWEEGDEPLEEDELPEYLRKPPQIDLTKLDTSNPEAVLKATKTGKTLMMFVTVDGNPTKDKTEEITKLWQTGLFNAHIPVERFLVSDDRAIFMFKDGSLAWPAKDYLIEQQQCKDVQIEGKTYPGKYSQKSKEEL